MTLLEPLRLRFINCSELCLPLAIGLLDQWLRILTFRLDQNSGVRPPRHQSTDPLRGVRVILLDTYYSDGFVALGRLSRIAKHNLNPSVDDVHWTINLW